MHAGDISTWRIRGTGRRRIDDRFDERPEKDVGPRVVKLLKHVLGLKLSQFVRRRQRLAVADHDQLQARHDEQHLIARAGAPHGVLRQPFVAAAVVRPPSHAAMSRQCCIMNNL
ncbi:MAG: hypothetical protein LC742_10170, partial [Acidobacteria bacterium]|nr:hypothetical protein [Acidobacteriota bacterium]